MMTAATLDSTANFSMSPLARAAGAHLRPATGMVHGTDAEGAAKGITLAEAKRIAFEAAERVWRASSDAFKSFLEMLLNLLRWISRPFRNGPAPTQAAGTGESVGTSGTPKGDPNGLLSPSEIAAEHNVSKIPGETGVASFAARSGTTGSDLVPVEPATIEAVVESVAKKIPNLEDADPRVLTLATTSSLLDQHATRLLELKARAQEIGEAMNAEVAALARAQGRNPDAVLNLVLSDPEEGGDQGNEIRRLFWQGADVEAQASACQGEIENALLLARSQGLDVATLVEGTKVPQAVPQWSALVEAAAPSSPATLSPAERRSLALVADPDSGGLEVDPTPAEKAQRLKATLNLNTERLNEHEAERSSA